LALFLLPVQVKKKKIYVLLPWQLVPLVATTKTSMLAHKLKKKYFTVRSRKILSVGQVVFIPGILEDKQDNS
jgi:hypothetical protein